MTAPAVGGVIGNYVLRAVIGSGGMSEVYAAEHRFLGDAVAIKVLRSHLAGDDAACARFLAEATRTRAIEHPNVVRVLDCGRDAEHGVLYLVMERLAGEDLAARLRRVRRLDDAEVRRLGAALAEGMHAAHRLGIVHRDLKPANVMLQPDGTPKIVDFGISKRLGGDAAAADATGQALGTPAYMAPEQITGGVVAPCVDVWALGVVLFEAVTGRLPFEGFEGGRCPQLFDAPPRPGELAPVSAALEAVLLACLAKHPGERPASMQELATRLRASDGEAPERVTQVVAPVALAKPVAAPAPAAATRPRRRSRAAKTAAALVVALAAITTVWLATRGDAPAPPSAPVAAPAGPPAQPPAPAAPPTAPPAASPAPAAGPPAPRPRSRPRPPRDPEPRSPVYGEGLD